MRIEDLHSFEDNFEAARSLLISFVGYEERSIFLLKKSLKIGVKWTKIFTFSNSQEAFSLASNLKWAGAKKLTLTETSRCKLREGLYSILKAIRVLKRANKIECLDVHIDYSSLPREWYCMLFWRLSRRKGIRLFGWYVAGSYKMADTYPCVGVGEWEIFFSQSRITSRSRSTILGLSLDWVRTLGIIDRLNSDEYYAVAASPLRGGGMKDILEKLNYEIISGSQNFTFLPIEDFSRMFFGVRDIILHLLGVSDVEVVADGPKPLVLAMTLAAATFGRPGVHCWHVRHAENAPLLEVTVADSEAVHGFNITHCDHVKY
jgi:hypothetical protein